MGSEIVVTAFSCSRLHALHDTILTCTKLSMCFLFVRSHSSSACLLLSSFSTPSQHFSSPSCFHSPLFPALAFLYVSCIPCCDVVSPVLCFHHHVLRFVHFLPIFSSFSILQILQHDRRDSPTDAKAAYRTMSLKVHPDRNPSPTASEEFVLLRQAFDCLSNPRLRDIYDKFGPSGLKQEERNPSGFSDIGTLIGIAMFYVIWGVFSFLFTLSKKTGSARQAAFTGLIILLVVEFNMKFMELDFLTALFPYTTIYEKVNILHLLFPAFLNGTICVASAWYVDVDMEMRNLMAALLYNSKLTLDVLQYLVEHQRKGKQPQPQQDGANGAIKDISSTLNEAKEEAIVEQLAEAQKAISETRLPIGIKKKQRVKPGMPGAPVQSSGGWSRLFSPSTLMFIGFVLLSWFARS